MQQLFDIYQQIPLSVRLAVLLLFFACASSMDLWLRPQGSSRWPRWREYGFLLTTGLLGAGVGCGVDQLTFRLSADYFIIGKGLSPGPDLAAEVLDLSLHAGCVAGLLAGAALLLANNPRPGLRQLRFGRLLARCGYPLAGLALTLLIAPLLYLVDPLDAAQKLAEQLPAAAIERFRWVWALHFGVYAGGLLGTVGGCVSIRRERRAG